MKHIQKEWYTCDRCGDKIKDTPSNIIGIPFIRMVTGGFVKMHMLTADKAGYVCNEKLILPDVFSAEITEYYDGKDRTIHLCGKCRKEFDKFMKMR